MAAGKVEHLGYLRLGNLVCIDPAQPNTLLVDVKHDPGRLLAGAIKETLEDEHDEFHRRVIIIEKQNPVERRLLGFDRNRCSWCSRYTFLCEIEDAFTAYIQLCTLSRQTERSGKAVKTLPIGSKI